MGVIDYMKVIDIVSKTFEANREVHLNALHDRQDKIDKFDITMTLKDGREILYRIFLFKHDLEIIFRKEHFEDMKFSKWVSVFEYELEQALLTNIRLNVTKDPDEYRVKVMF